MNIKKLKIEGYRLFKDEFNIKLNEGLNIIVGENGCGKTTIIDALRLIFSEDEYGRTGITEYDFNKSLNGNEISQLITISCDFENLNDDSDKLAFITWLDGDDTSKAKLNLSLENIENHKGFFNKRKIWGGDSISGLFEYKVMDKINCIYLPPLRDAENKLKAYRGSRLSRLFKKIVPKDEQVGHPIVEKVENFNKELTNDDSPIKEIDQTIRVQLKEAIGSVFGQDTKIQYSESTFSKIVESLKLVYFPKLLQDTERNAVKHRSLSENSLGYNNLIYIATILAEMLTYDDSNSSLNLLLIEEPEAHLHPQLQIRLLQYLHTKALEKNIQVIVTTHSPTLAASVDLEAINVITKDVENNVVATPLRECGLTEENNFFLSRWLDITKSTLLFSRAVMLVEGIAEALIIPELAKLYILEYNESNPETKLPISLEEAGISIINMNGIYFNHFMQLFKGYVIKDDSIEEVSKIPNWCAGITDCDPDKDSQPTFGTPCECKNPKYHMINTLKEHSGNCRLYSNLKTFEYDLAMESGNLKELLLCYSEYYKIIHPELSQTAEENSKKDWNNESEELKASNSKWLLERIGKGEFAQYIALKLQKKEITLSVPAYIKKAIFWVMKGNDEL